jgi:hypothetical protein
VPLAAIAGGYNEIPYAPEIRSLPVMTQKNQYTSANQRDDNSSPNGDFFSEQSKEFSSEHNKNLQNRARED